MFFIKCFVTFYYSFMQKNKSLKISIFFSLMSNTAKK